MKAKKIEEEEAEKKGEEEHEKEGKKKKKHLKDYNKKTNLVSVIYYN